MERNQVKTPEEIAERFVELGPCGHGYALYMGGKKSTKRFSSYGEAMAMVDIMRDRVAAAIRAYAAQQEGQRNG